MAEQEVKEKKSKAPTKKGEKAGKAKGKEVAAKAADAKTAAVALPADYTPRLMKLYREQIASDLMKKFGYQNRMLLPALQKIVLNVGSGTLHQDPKLAESVSEELGVIAGQKAVFTRAHKSISNFKLRQGMVVGCRVTLRGWQMYEFLDRLISIAIPRIRDFRGLSDRSFDGRGNYTFGVKEQIIFPEIDYDKVVKIHGMDITIATSARNDEEALALISGFGFPFRRTVRGAEKEAA